MELTLLESMTLNGETYIKLKDAEQLISEEYTKTKDIPKKENASNIVGTLELHSGFLDTSQVMAIGSAKLNAKKYTVVNMDYRNLDAVIKGLKAMGFLKKGDENISFALAQDAPMGIGKISAKDLNEFAGIFIAPRIESV
jgi:hypothetical protein